MLAAAQGNKTKAAEMLGISRKTLWEKMNTYGL
jgi:DNA-binding protein Fis